MWFEKALAGVSDLYRKVFRLSMRSFIKFRSLAEVADECEDFDY